MVNELFSAIQKASGASNTFFEKYHSLNSFYSSYERTIGFSWGFSSGLFALLTTQAEVRQAGGQVAELIDYRVHAKAVQTQGGLAA